MHDTRAKARVIYIILILKKNKKNIMTNNTATAPFFISMLHFFRTKTK